MKKLFLVLSLLFPSIAFSAGMYDKQYKTNSGHSYDFKSGNNYHWNTDPAGNTRVYGNNYNTGSIWNTTIDKNGNMNGSDSDGNFWNYNKKSGTYMNYGTGEIRNEKLGW